MPVDQYGRVVVNPSVPLGMADFAQLYTANGNTPQQNSSQLLFDAPAEGRSYIEDQWSKMNRGSSPEQYFSNPENVAAALATVHPSAASASRAPAGGGGTSSSPSVGPQWPTFNNADERNIAINTGAYDPQYTTPEKRIASVTERVHGHPYSEILTDPEVMKIMGADPKRGAFLYSALTGGRDFERDRNAMDADVTQKATEARYYEHQKYSEKRAGRMMDEHERRAEILRKQRIQEEDQHKLEEAHNQWGMKRFQQLQENGAKYDPETGELMTWDYQMPKNDGTQLGPQKPVRVLSKAHPEDEAIWRKFYPIMMNEDAPDKPAPETLAAFQAQQKSVASVPDTVREHVSQMLDVAKMKKGGQLTVEEQQQVIAKASEEAKPLFSMDSSPSRFDETFQGFLGNMMGKSDWHPTQPTGTVNKLNAWGNLVDKMKSDELASRLIQN